MNIAQQIKEYDVNKIDLSGSPHLSIARLRHLLLSRLGDALQELRHQESRPLRVLNVGAGSGEFMDVLLNEGMLVTAVDISHVQLQKLKERVGSNPLVEIVCQDINEYLRGLDEHHNCFDLILYNAVLHHIPDYLETIGLSISHLRPGGVIFTFLDPIRYSDTSKMTRFLSQCGYFAWRIFQGNYRRGLATRWRRLRGVLDESNPSDMAEYHVVRGGMDVSGITNILEESGFETDVATYFSTAPGPFYTLGHWLGCRSNFAITAKKQADKSTINNDSLTEA